MVNDAIAKAALNEQYEENDSKIVKYYLCPLEGTTLKIRDGVDTSKPFAVAIGAAATFGRFVSDPYTKLLSIKCGVPILNLGFPGVGPGFFLRRPELFSVINNAEFAVVEAMAGTSHSFPYILESDKANARRGPSDNNLVGPGNLSGLMAFEGESSTAIASIAQERLLWIQEMTELFKRITVPQKCLLWLSKRMPEFNKGLDNIIKSWAEMPQYVNREMLNELIGVNNIEFIEIVSREGLPHLLIDVESKEPVEIWPEKRFPNVKARNHNHLYPSPQMHGLCADALANWCFNRSKSRESSSASDSPRRVIAHHHIFKNAGSSLDKALADALGQRWRPFDPQIFENEIEDPIEGKISRKTVKPENVCSDELENFLDANVEIYAISTHQGRAKFPLSKKYEKLELSLIRNPIGRALSMWRFNKRSERQTTFDSKLLKQSDLLSFEEFIKWCINRKVNPVAPFSNFQVRVLSGKTTLSGRVTYSDLDKAYAYVTRVGCVGVVESFYETLQFFNRRIATFIPGIELKQYTVNTSGAVRESGDEEARQLLSKRTYESLLEANALDLALYEQVKRVGGF